MTSSDTSPELQHEATSSGKTENPPDCEDWRKIAESKKNDFVEQQLQELRKYIYSFSPSKR